MGKRFSFFFQDRLGPISFFFSFSLLSCFRECGERERACRGQHAYARAYRTARPSRIVLSFSPRTVIRPFTRPPYLRSSSLKDKRGLSAGHALFLASRRGAKAADVGPRNGAPESTASQKTERKDDRDGGRVGKGKKKGAEQREKRGEKGHGTKEKKKQESESLEREKKKREKGRKRNEKKKKRRDTKGAKRARVHTDEAQVGPLGAHRERRAAARWNHKASSCRCHRARFRGGQRKDGGVCGRCRPARGPVGDGQGASRFGQTHALHRTEKGGRWR